MNRPGLLTRHLLAPLLIATALCVGWTTPAAADPQENYDAAGDLIQQSVTIRRDGQHSQLLRALRHLRTPTLKPLYEALSENDHPVFLIHGLLGLAEISDPPRLNLERAAQIESSPVRNELLGAAIEDGLISDADAQTLLTWGELEIGAKLLIAARMLEEGRFDKPEVLREGLDSASLARRSLAGLLLLQTGDEKGLTVLQELDRSTDPTRDTVRAMLLQSAMQYKLRAVAPWAAAIASDEEAPPALAELAMRTAMRFGDRAAVEMWRKQFLAQDNLAGRIKQAFIALHLAPWLDPGVFDMVIASHEPFLKKIGEAGAAVARDDKNAEVPIIALLETYHPIAARWALSYAQNVAEPADAQQIFLGLILIDEQGPARGREQRLLDAAGASRSLAEMDIKVATSLLRPILASPATDRRLAQAILLGLVQSNDTQTGVVVAGLPDFVDPTTNQLALLLRLRADEKLTPVQQKDVGILIRGGGSLQPSLRIQAAWKYLEQKGQTQKALAEALASLRS